MVTLKQLEVLSQNSHYWLTYIIGSFAMLCIALYYQYILEVLPCVVCIQVRLWFTLLMLVSFAGLFYRNSIPGKLLANISVVLIAAALIERSYLLLGTERGFIFSDCGFDLGLPAWFAIDQWLPWLYYVETSCGYTPEIIFGITMAEVLMALSVLLFTVSLAVTGSALLYFLRSK